MPQEAAGSADCGPSATVGGVILVLSFPREFCAGRSVAYTVANVEKALERTEGEAGYQLFLEKPLLGYGPGNERSEILGKTAEIGGDPIAFSHAHNLFLNAGLRPDF